MIQEPQKDVLWDISNYFHYPVGKSREYSRLRQQTTDKFGRITTIVLVCVVLAIPIQKFFLLRGWYITRNAPVLRTISALLNKYIYASDDLYVAHGKSRWKKFQNTIASATKLVLFSLSLHSTTIVQIVFWAVVLSLLSLADIYRGDLIFLAKRLGRICTVCLPTVFFLSLRPLPLPHTLYLSLLPIHKWLSRMIILQGILHTGLYCGFFQKNHTWNKAWKTENIYGWIALTGFVLILITSLLKLRNRWYKLFYFNHYVSSWVIVLCLQMHGRPYDFTYYTAANILILSSQIAYRWWLTALTPTKDDLKVTDVSPNLALIEFPNTLIRKRASNPGAHIRLTTYHRSSWLVNMYKQLIPNYHPYTLVSLPQDRVQKLIIRKSTFKIVNNQQYLICGSYDPHLLFLSSKNSTNRKFSISKLSINAKRLLIVIGGSAISFALPLLRVMNYHGVPVKIVWVIRDFRDILILKYFDGYIHGDDLEIFITGSQFTGTDTEGSMHRKSYGSLLPKKSQTNLNGLQVDLESNENTPLINGLNNTSLNYENESENVVVSVDPEEHSEQSDDECVVPEQTHRHNSIDSSIHSEEEDEEQDFGDGSSLPIGEALSRSHSQKTSTSMNEQFVPTVPPNSSDSTKVWVNQFQETVKRLNIEHKVYKGRPILNYKYYNWCINEGFTQCSGPVQDDNNNYICCRDLPKNRVVQEDIDCEKIWVVSAGPQQLVKNVKLWANEYGLKFHEEAFYV